MKEVVARFIGMRGVFRSGIAIASPGQPSLSHNISEWNLGTPSWRQREVPVQNPIARKALNRRPSVPSDGSV